MTSNAAVTHSDGAITDGFALTVDALQAKLSAFEIPKKIYFPNRFPRTSKGDGDRRALSATATEPGSR
jgi:acyl-coenzyme A synthetase/AMP-(fatty) acid ligase